MVNAAGCIAIAKIDLRSKLAAEVKPELYIKTHCDEDIDGVLDGIYKVDVNSITPFVLQIPADYVVRYYDTEIKANAGSLTDNIPGIFSFPSNTSVWIRVEPKNGCPAVVKEILLKTGIKLAVASPVNKNVCDNDLNNTEDINLDTYLPDFTTDSYDSVKYFDDLIKAQNNLTGQNIPAAQTITGDKIFYYRFTKAGVCDALGTLNISFKASTPSTVLPPSVPVCQGSTTTLNVGTGYSSVLWSTGATTTTITVGEGTYWVDLTNSSGCVYRQDVTVVESPKPVWNIAAYNATICDDNFDGIIPVKFSTITPVIITNSALFTVEYSLSPTFSPLLPNDWTYSANTTVYVRAVSNVCPTETKTLNFKIGDKLPLIKNIVAINVCDNDLNNTENINLANYLDLFITNPYDSVKYFDDLTKAQNNLPGQNIPAAQTITGDKTFYCRFTKAGVCDALGTLNISFKASTPSTVLPASVPVCQGSTTTLNVGTGYSSVLWSTGATTTTINVGVGTYWVDLTNASGCIYHQSVTVVESPKPVWNIAAYNATICDDNFDGIIPVKFSTITPVIMTNAALFTVEYSLSPTFSPLLPNDWTYSANTTVYVRAVSAYCPTETKTIDFKIGNKLPLIKNVVAITVCDNDRNSTENINLADYRNLFTADATASVKYFDDLTKAQNNLPGQNIPAAQTITGDKIFYYRFTKAGICDAIGTLNISFKASTPSTILPPSVPVCQGSTTTLNVGTGYSSVLWSTGATTTTINVGVGTYWVDLTNASGCVYRQDVSVVESPKPVWNIAAYNATICDDDFDGNIPVKFSNITPVIITNAALFTVEYSLSPTFSPLLPNDWTYSANTTVYVRAVSAYCPTETKTIDFKIGDKLNLIKTTYIDAECDDDFDGIKTVYLSDYVSKFTTEAGVTATYFKTLVDSQQNIGSIPSAVVINNSGTYYIRFNKNGICDTIGILTINIKIPKKSTTLEDKNICPEATTTLDAGSGFTNYLWSTGATSQTVKVPVGEYWVELTYDGCIYKQYVSVKAVSLPQITGVEIQGGTVTVTVTGGNAPYQYSINSYSYQSSNVFTNVPAGDYTIYVISADQCLPTTTNINILRILNVITPNDDGKNDVLDYSDLLRKDNPFLQIFDRYGVSVFKGDKNNSFSWDGKSAGKVVATGSYWYVLQWQEPGSATVSKLTGWVLVKTRE